MKIRSTLLLLAGLCASLAQAQEVLGILGQTTESSSIFARMRRGSRVYYRAKAYEYLVIQDTGNESWYRVLLQNGIYGYVSTNSVARLPYKVTSKAHSSQASRGGSAARYRMATDGSSGSYVVNEGLKHIGTPYKWGGDDINNGIDCSGFVKKLYGKIGVDLPRTAEEQATVGMPITRLEDLQAGDRLYFWENKRGKIGHTGIYMGGGYFVHSSMGHHGVATDFLTERWRRILVAARR